MYKNIVSKLLVIILLPIDLLLGSCSSDNDKLKTAYDSGIAAKNAGNYEIAIEKFQEAIRIKPEYHLAFFEIGNINILQNDFDTALVNYKKSSKLAPNFTQAKVEVARVTFWQNNHKKALEIIEDVLASEENISAIKLKGKIYLSQNKLDESQAIYEQAIKISPKDYEILESIGNIYYAKGNYQNAKNKYEEAKKLSPNSKKLIAKINRPIPERTNPLMEELVNSDPKIKELHSKAIEHKGNGEYGEAISTLKIAENINPNLPLLHLELARIYTSQGNDKKALISYERALELNNNVVEALIGMSRILSWQEKYDEAEEKIKKALTIETTNIEANKLAARIYYYQNKLEEADKYYSQVAKTQKNDVEVLTRLGDIAFSQRKYKISKNYYERALTIVPNSEELKVKLAREQLTSLRQKENEKIARKTIMASEPIIPEQTKNTESSKPQQKEANKPLEPAQKQSLELFKEKKSSQEKNANIRSSLNGKFDDLYNEGIKLKNSGQYRKALLQYQKALKLKDNFAPLYVEIATVNGFLKDYKNSLLNYDMALDIDDRLIAAQIGKARVLSWQGQYDQALASALIAMNNDSKNIEAIILVGRIYYYQGNFTQANKYYNMALNYSPNNPEIMEMLGDVSFADRNYDKALSYYDMAAKIDPNIPSIKNKLSRKPPKELEPKQIVKASEADEFKKLYDLAVTENNNRNYEKAIGYLFDAKKINPNSPLIYLELGNIYSRLNLREKAINNYDKALNIDGNLKSAQIGKYRVWSWQGKYEPALSGTIKLIEDDPVNTDALKLAGRIYYYQKDYDKSKQYFDKALKLSPEDTDALISYGDIEFAAGNYDKAKEKYLAANKIDPNSQEIIKKLNRKPPVPIIIVNKKSTDKENNRRTANKKTKLTTIKSRNSIAKLKTPNKKITKSTKKSDSIIFARKEYPKVENVAFGYGRSTFDEDFRKPWREAFANISFAINEDLKLNLKAEWGRRFKVNELFLQAGVFAKLNNRLRAFATIGTTPNPDFWPKYEVRAGGSYLLFDNRGIIDATVINADVEWSKYTTGNSANITIGVEQFLFSGKFSVIGQIISATDSGKKWSSGALFKANWTATDRLRFFSGLANTYEFEEGKSIPTFAIFAGGEYDLNEYMSLRLDVGTEDREDSYNRNIVYGSVKFNL